MQAPFSSEKQTDNTLTNDKKEETQRLQARDKEEENN